MAGEELSALRFPTNVGDGSDTAAPYAVIKFANPQSDGLPVWGPANAGVTIIRRVRPLAQDAYCAMGWWSQDNGTITFDDTHPYWGGHPYPDAPGDPPFHGVEDHIWEVAAQGQDKFDESGSSDRATGTPVVKDAWVTQALRVTYNGNSTKSVRLYPDVSDMEDYAEYITTATYGESLAAINFAYTIGDSPWFAEYQHERFGGDLSWIKIIAKSMSDADIESEAADKDSLVTTDAQNNNWWSKKGFSSVDDLTDDFGEGRAFVRDDDEDEITLVAQG